VIEIVVVGAGVVGLAFSVGAARQGFAVEVFDRKPPPKLTRESSCNVLAINPASRRFLQEEGVWSGIAEHHRTPYSDMSVMDGTGSGSVCFSADEMGLAELGHIVDQPALLAALVEMAQSLDNLRLNWQSQADFHQGDVPLLVGADGLHSAIRDQLKLRTIGYDYHQTATVCVARTEEPHSSCARQWFLTNGPLAMLPLGDRHEVAVVWSSFQSMTVLDDQAFAAELFHASEGELGRIVAVGPRFEFPLRQQQVLQCVGEGFALLGDAAHAIHPLAGQGANLGFGDARVLVTELSAARIEGRAPGDLDVLKRYERSRLVENHLTALATEGFHRLFTSKMTWAMLLRNQGLRFFDSSATLKKLAIGFASK